MHTQLTTDSPTIRALMLGAKIEAAIPIFDLDTPAVPLTEAQKSALATISADLRSGQMREIPKHIEVKCESKRHPLSSFISGSTRQFIEDGHSKEAVGEIAATHVYAVRPWPPAPGVNLHAVCAFCASTILECMEEATAEAAVS